MLLSYSEVIETSGIKVPFLPAIITPKIERPMRNSRYEAGECAALQRILRPGDRVLELGAGVGLLSTVAAVVPGVAAVTTVEANPDLIPLIRETHRLNRVASVDLRNGVATAEPGPDIDFYLRPDFWASSMEPGSRRYSKVATLPRYPLTSLIKELNPTVIVCDIEGGEMGLFDAADLSGVRALVVEFHAKVYGEEGVQAILSLLAAKGFHLSAESKAGSTVQHLERRPLPAPALANRPWPKAAPRVLVATCMKDEGPFVLEWLAWHKAVGVTDIVVYTNDCTDGTDRLLDRLMALGHLTHKVNPAVATGATAFQPIALANAAGLPVLAECEFFLSIDVDEFVNIRTGDGTLAALLQATGRFDVLSMSEVNHGANGQQDYARGWLTELFPRHQSTHPGPHKARRGVKSLVALSDKVIKLRNHRPDMGEGAVWLDGSGRPLASLAADPGENGVDCRGTYALVRLEHFALRSLASYLAKMDRGDVVVAGKRVSEKYWRQRNRNEEATSANPGILAAAKAWWAAHLASDAEVMALHEAACAAHETRIARLLTQPDYIARRDWALAQAW